MYFNFRVNAGVLGINASSAVALVCSGRFVKYGSLFNDVAQICRDVSR